MGSGVGGCRRALAPCPAAGNRAMGARRIAPLAPYREPSATKAPASRASAVSREIARKYFLR